MVWDPRLKKDKLLLESVQRFALKIIDRSCHAESNSALLLKYGLPTLEARRSYFCTLTTFKFLNGILFCPGGFYSYVAAPNLRTCHSYQLVQPFAGVTLFIILLTLSQLDFGTPYLLVL